MAHYFKKWHEKYYESMPLEIQKNIQDLYELATHPFGFGNSSLVPSGEFKVSPAYADCDIKIVGSEGV